MWYFYFYHFSLPLCLSFPVFAGPLACSKRGLIQSCEAQVQFGCKLLPTGIRRWRASAKTTAYIDPGSLCRQRCLNQWNMHSEQHIRMSESFFFFPGNSKCFTTYFHEYFFCEALNSVRHRFGPSVILQGCCKNLGRCNPLLDKTTRQRKQMRTIKYWRWQYSAGCNYLNNNILLLVQCSNNPGRDWSNDFECWLSVLVYLKTNMSSN